ncbi:MAG: dephospho-CoA kinase [Wolbachia endosymbiont of Meromenopon meropis]|nr:dephospho-CoA kinase [Wolbachia endosymbiont of Meromenopon meropis]
MIIGLIGGIGVGKSFVANCFKKLGAAVFDADSVVHKLYEKDKRIIDYAKENFPGGVISSRIDKKILSKYFLAYDKNWKRFQSLVHSTVQSKLEIFVAYKRKINKKLIILDIPLLLEIIPNLYWDIIIFVYANNAIQVQRLNKRNINKEKLNLISNLQLPTEQKRQMSNFTIDNSTSKEHVILQIKNIIDSLNLIN